MHTSQDQSQNLQQAQLQKIAPHLIQASEILQFTSVELRQAIERELMENPAIETIEGSTSDRCAECTVPADVCLTCPFGESRSASADLLSPRTAADAEGEAGRNDDPAVDIGSDAGGREEVEYEPDSEPEYDMGSLMAMSDLSDPIVKDALEDAYDPLSLAPASPSLRDHLLSRLRSMSRSESGYRTCEYLVNALDERGWLKIDRVEAMIALSITEETLDQAIGDLQNCDPPGIGARDLRECLLIQVQQLEDEGCGNVLAKRIIESHWELLTQRRFDQLARRTNSTRSAVTEAVRFIQTELSPDPAARFREPWDYKPDSNTEAIKPDVIIRRTDTGFDIEIAGPDLPTLHINARYRKLYESLKEHKKTQTAAGADPAPAQSGGWAANRISSQERRHIALYVERANLFLKNIQQRRKTIERITRCIIEAQQGFIETGSRAFLIPMTRTDIAQRAGLHESTVSRALLRKFVQLPNQDVVSFDAFFAPAGSVKDMIASMIATEDENNPYSDEALRTKLEEAGINIARRTIVKYRESLRIPASYLRRRH
jgi:RNA polymerase sigma-54 factor